VNAAEVVALVRRQPFEPFTIRVADGRHFVIRHPEFIELNAQRRTATVFDRETRTTAVLDLFHVTALETVTKKTDEEAGGENGPEAPPPLPEGL
jgi:hypothetical protein